MKFSKDFKRVIVAEQTSIFDCLKIIEGESLRTLFIVNDAFQLVGSFTFGDFNRWLLKQSIIDLSNPIKNLMNIKPCSVSMENRATAISMLDKFDIVPLIDDRSRVVGIYTRTKASELYVGDRRLSKNHSPLIIAEIGNNHNGSIELAKQLVDLAKESGADIAKFQLRDMQELYGDVDSTATKNLGNEYTMDLLNRFQLPTEELLEVLGYSAEQGLLPLCTPFDAKSVETLENFGVQAYKIASADLTNHTLLDMVASTGKPMFCSTGMATEKEIIETVAFLKGLGANYALLHCNSTYPAPFEAVNLAYIDRLIELGECVVGYSGHERGINVAIASVARGARIIEKHLTVDRKMEGNDHKVSLLPHEFKDMVTGIKQVYSSLGDDTPREISQGEQLNRITLAKSLYAQRDLKKGEMINKSDIIIRSPGHGLQPNKISDLLSIPLKRNIRKGDVFYDSDLEIAEGQTSTEFAFEGNWGIPVRHHDYENFLKIAQPKVLEFHLSYADLRLSHSDFLNFGINCDLVVHSPELFYGDHVLDLTSDNDEYRAMSIENMRDTIHTVEELSVNFQNHGTKISLVTNVGGFSMDAPLDDEQIKLKTEILLGSLSELESNFIEILPQTMPPFPWHFGGQRYHNLFLDADWIDRFCTMTGAKICLDTSHSALRCNQKGYSFSDFLDKVLPHTKHIHFADAKGVHDEGLQIGSGDIDWNMVCAKVNELAPEATWIPEIWQGHEDQGKKFWLALEHLKKAGIR